LTVDGSITGDIAYEIPGAEMYLGIDMKASSIYYLTNLKFSDMEHPCTDPIEARFSSPPVVKMITIEKARMIQEILNEPKANGGDKQTPASSADSKLPGFSGITDSYALQHILES